MDITAYLDKECIEIGAEIFSKDEALRTLTRMNQKNGKLHDENRFLEEIRKKEEEASSAVGARIAIPDIDSPAVKAASVSILSLKDGVDFHARDKKAVKLIVMITANNEEEKARLKNRILRLFSSELFRAKLCACQDADEVITMFQEREKQLR